MTILRLLNNKNKILTNKTNAHRIQRLSRIKVQKASNLLNTVFVLILIEQFRASAANTPTATTPKDVSHSRERTVEGKES